MKKGLRIRVIENCGGDLWWFALFLNNKPIPNENGFYGAYFHKRSAQHAAKKLSERTGIPYDSNVYKIHGC